MRLIDADELKELFREVIGGIAKKPEIQKDLEHMVRASAMTIQMIDDAPTIEAEPVRLGRWVMVKRGEQHNHYQCSECGQFLITSEDLIRKEKYCFTCGAKMEVEDETN